MLKRARRGLGAILTSAALLVGCHLPAPVPAPLPSDLKSVPVTDGYSILANLTYTSQSGTPFQDVYENQAPPGALPYDADFWTNMYTGARPAFPDYWQNDPQYVIGYQGDRDYLLIYDMEFTDTGYNYVFQWAESLGGYGPPPSPEPSYVPTPIPTSTPTSSPENLELTFYVPTCGPDSSDLPEQAGPKKGYRVALAELGPGTCGGRELTPEEQSALSATFNEYSIELASDAWDLYNSPYVQAGLMFVQPELWAAGKGIAAANVAGSIIISQNFRNGKLAEKAVSKWLPLVNNIKDSQYLIRAREYSFLKKDRVLDFVTANAVIEVKNTKMLYASSQLKDIFNYARSQGLQAVLITDAKYMTPRLKALLDEHKVHVVNIPWHTLY